jgi:hypothetical protein
MDQKKEWPVAVMFVDGLLPTKFRFIWPSGFRGEDFLEINQSETRMGYVGHIFLTDPDKLTNLYRRTSIDASYQMSVHLGKWFQTRRLFRNQPIKNKNCLWWPCLLTDRH